MSYALWWVSLTAGVENGLNPCLLMTAALVLLGIMFAKKNGINKAWFNLFVAIFILDTFTFNFGFLDKFLINKYFIYGIKVIYVLFAAVTGYVGIKLLKEWFDLSRGKEIKAPTVTQIKLSPGLLFLIVSLLALFLSALATIWPSSYYMMLFSMYMLSPGQFITMGSLVFLYIVVSVWFIAVVMYGSILEAKNPRLFKMLASSVLISASIGVLDIIFMKGYRP